MRDRHADGRRAVEDAVLQSPGHTSPALRRSLVRGEAPPDDLKPLVEKVRKHAYQVTDEDIASLSDRYSDDELFEVLVSSALGAALLRLDAGLAALEDEP